MARRVGYFSLYREEESVAGWKNKKKNKKEREKLEKRNGRERKIKTMQNNLPTHGNWITYRWNVKLARIKEGPFPRYVYFTILELTDTFISLNKT